MNDTTTTLQRVVVGSSLLSGDILGLSVYVIPPDRTVIRLTQRGTLFRATTIGLVLF